MALDSPLPKGLPHNEEAERTLLGAILVDNENLYSALEVLEDDDFYRDGHRKIFAHMRALADASSPIDLVTLKNELTRRGELESVGGVAFVASLVDGIPRATNASHYARIIQEKSVLRGLIRQASSIITACTEEEESTAELVDQAEQRIFEVSERKARGGLRPFKTVADGTLQVLERIRTTTGNVTGQATGFVDLDRMTAGLQPSDLIILAARPSMGKTAFSLDIARNVAKGTAEHPGRPVAYFSLEMAAEQLVLRMLCAEGMVNGQQLRTNQATERDWEALATSMGNLAEVPLHFDDAASATVLEMKAKARRLKSQVGELGLVVVDYLQLMRGVGKQDNRQTEIASISRALKGMAKELEVPVLALSQLSRSIEDRKGHRPQLADLRESGAIEQDADLVMFIFREEVYEATEENHGLAEIIIGKQRNGPIGSLEVAFLQDFARFENLELRRDS